MQGLATRDYLQMNAILIRLFKPFLILCDSSGQKFDYKPDLCKESIDVQVSVK